MFINNNLNKGISMPIVILIIMAAAVIGGGLVLWQYSEIQKETADVPGAEDNGKEPEDVAVVDNNIEDIFDRKNIDEKDERKETVTTIDICKEAQDKNKCYWNFAKNQNNPSLCEKINFLPYKNACYLHVAFYTKNPFLCEKLEDIDLSGEEIMALDYIDSSIEFLESKEKCKVISKKLIFWKAYQDEKYGYEISYPNNFFVSESDGYVRTSFTSPENVLKLTDPYEVLWGGKYDSDFMYIHIENIENEKDLEEWVAKEFGLGQFKEFDISPEESNWGIDSAKKIIVGKDIKGIKVHGWAQAHEWNKRYVKVGDKIIVIGNDVFSESENTPTFDQMLSSFKFIE